MKIIREHIAFRLLWLVLALHIFNCSVDTPDLQPDSVPEDLSYNDMESVVEIVLEQVLDINNAIAEHDENDTDEGSGGLTIKKGVDFSYYESYFTVSFSNTVRTICKDFNYIDGFTSQFHPELTPPPPKA
jgi:hypothetical protein